MIANGILILTSLFLQGCAQNVKGSLRKQEDIGEETEKTKKKIRKFMKKCRLEYFICEDKCSSLEDEDLEWKCTEKCNEDSFIQNELFSCRNSIEFKNYQEELTKYNNQLKKNARSANKKYKKCKGDINYFSKNNEDKKKCRQIAKEMKLRFIEVEGRIAGVGYPQCYRFNTRISWNKSDEINNTSSERYDQAFGICKDTDKIGWKEGTRYK